MGAYSKDSYLKMLEQMGANNQNALNLQQAIEKQNLNEPTVTGHRNAEGSNVNSQYFHTPDNLGRTHPTGSLSNLGGAHSPDPGMQAGRNAFGSGPQGTYVTKGQGNYTNAPWPSGSNNGPDREVGTVEQGVRNSQSNNIATQRELAIRNYNHRNDQYGAATPNPSPAPGNGGHEKEEDLSKQFGSPFSLPRLVR